MKRHFNHGRSTHLPLKLAGDVALALLVLLVLRATGAYI